MYWTNENNIPAASFWQKYNSSILKKKLRFDHFYRYSDWRYGVYYHCRKTEISPNEYIFPKSPYKTFEELQINLGHDCFRKDLHDRISGTNILPVIHPEGLENFATTFRLFLQIYNPWDGNWNRQVKNSFKLLKRIRRRRRGKKRYRPDIKES